MIITPLFLLLVLKLFDQQSDHVQHRKSDAQKSSNHKTDGASAGIVVEQGVDDDSRHYNQRHNASGWGIHEVISRFVDKLIINRPGGCVKGKGQGEGRGVIFCIFLDLWVEFSAQL